MLLSSIKTLVDGVKACMDAKDYNKALVMLQEMILIAEKQGDTVLVENYKKKFEELLKLSTEP